MADPFLAPLLSNRDDRLCLRNRRSGRVLADRLIPALDSKTRKKGLLGRTSLADGEAMVIAPTNAIHTWFMRFAIDIVFVNREGRVVKARSAVKPWRMTGALRGYAAIELPAGSLESHDTIRGDLLEISPA
jgi:uncharacterized membrane protein (UPF0127 family)